ncbi:colicin V family bacteriocin [Tolypothrix sp. PCC 7910]|uniref:colicin V family bacteriocin n=1 Tax=Tolypothrix sp. PCC 7910 TaxID=2099387 RepID=UPI0014279C58|nr:colicin V family bacteriocin [Tolypothrix sp. PCC 7910]QIR35554.1 colicin V family bacteriocin [Tolypothrix sp. PCC 7910]
MNNEEHENQTPANTHPIATGLGAAGGGIAGAAIGRSIGGKVGAAIGGVAGAIAGGVAANELAEYADEFIEELQPTVGLGLGADHKPIELPRHYSWEELQALSKPQTGNVFNFEFCGKLRAGVPPVEQTFQDEF